MGLTVHAGTSGGVFVRVSLEDHNEGLCSSLSTEPGGLGTHFTPVGQDQTLRCSSDPAVQDQALW